MLFTAAGLEQATRAEVAVGHAQRFVDAGCCEVADLGCGIGAESLAMSSLGLHPHPVEIDPFTAAAAEQNLQRPVTVGDAQQVSLAGIDGVFLDPARRTPGHRDTRRLSSPENYSPSLSFAFGLAGTFPTGIKLGPGFDRDLIPPEAEAQWVSVGGSVVETGLWFGAVARKGVHRSALVIRDGTHSELTAAEDWPDAPTRSLGAYVYEPDGAVIRARLIGKVAEELGAGMLSDGIAYLTGDSPHMSPYATSFHILEELPAGEKQLRQALTKRGIGRLEIKKRGVSVDPAALRSRLRLRGPNEATLIMTRSGSRHLALLTERLSPTGTAT